MSTVIKLILLCAISLLNTLSAPQEKTNAIPTQTIEVEIICNPQ